MMNAAYRNDAVPGTGGPGTGLPPPHPVGRIGYTAAWSDRRGAGSGSDADAADAAADAAAAFGAGGGGGGSEDSARRASAAGAASILRRAKNRQRRESGGREVARLAGGGAPRAVDERLARQRERKGLCPTCGIRTHTIHRSRLGLSRKKTPIPRVEGRVIAGRCLLCRPCEGYMTRPTNRPPTHPLEVPETIEASPTRGVTPDDDGLSIVSGLTMDQTMMLPVFSQKRRPDRDSRDDLAAIEERPGGGVGGSTNSAGGEVQEEMVPRSEEGSGNAGQENLFSPGLGVVGQATEQQDLGEGGTEPIPAHFNPPGFDPTGPGTEIEGGLAHSLREESRLGSNSQSDSLVPNSQNPDKDLSQDRGGSRLSEGSTKTGNVIIEEGASSYLKTITTVGQVSAGSQNLDGFESSQDLDGFGDEESSQNLEGFDDVCSTFYKFDICDGRSDGERESDSAKFGETQKITSDSPNSVEGIENTLVYAGMSMPMEGQTGGTRVSSASEGGDHKNMLYDASGTAGQDTVDPPSGPVTASVGASGLDPPPMWQPDAPPPDVARPDEIIEDKSIEHTGQLSDQSPPDCVPGTVAESSRDICLEAECSDQKEDDVRNAASNISDKPPSEKSHMKKQESLDPKLAQQWREQALRQLDEESALQSPNDANLKDPLPAALKDCPSEEQESKKSLQQMEFDPLPAPQEEESVKSKEYQPNESIAEESLSHESRRVSDRLSHNQEEDQWQHHEGEFSPLSTKESDLEDPHNYNEGDDSANNRLSSAMHDYPSEEQELEQPRLPLDDDKDLAAGVAKLQPRAPTTASLSNDSRRISSKKELGSHSLSVGNLKDPRDYSEEDERDCSHLPATSENYGVNEHESNVSPQQDEREQPLLPFVKHDLADESKELQPSEPNASERESSSHDSSHCSNRISCTRPLGLMESPTQAESVKSGIERVRTPTCTNNGVKTVGADDREGSGRSPSIESRERVHEALIAELRNVFARRPPQVNCEGGEPAARMAARSRAQYEAGPPPEHPRRIMPHGRLGADVLAEIRAKSAEGQFLWDGESTPAVGEQHPSISDGCHDNCMQHEKRGGGGCSLNSDRRAICEDGGHCDLESIGLQEKASCITEEETDEDQSKDGGSLAPALTLSTYSEDHSNAQHGMQNHKSESATMRTSDSTGGGVLKEAHDVPLCNEGEVERICQPGQNGNASDTHQKAASSKCVSETSSTSESVQGSKQNWRKRPAISDIPTILRCLEVHPKNPLVHERVYEALYELASHSDLMGKMSIVRNGGTEAIVKGIWGNLEEHKVQVSALYALWALAASDEESKLNGIMSRSNAVGVIDAILISMQSHENDASVQLAGCGVLSCLASMASQTDDVDDGTSSGAMFAIMNAMKIHSTSKDVQEWSIRALYNECCNSDANKTRFVTDNDYGVDGLELILGALTNFPSDVSILEWACRLCYCISSNEKIARKMSSSVSLIGAIVNVMKNNGERMGTASLAASACGTLGNLSVLAELNFIPTLRSTGGIGAILDTMIFFSFSVHVNIKACAALAALAGNAQFRGTIFKMGGVKSILSSMEKFPNNALLLQEACRALCFLCIDSVDAKEAMSNDAAIFSIICALESHQDSDGVLEAGCSLLASLAVVSYRQERIVSAGGVQVIVNTMMCHVDKEKHLNLQEMCSLALWNFSFKTYNHDTILASGAVDASIQSMRSFTTSERVQENVMCMLWNLSADPRKVSTSSIDTGAVECIIMAMQNHPESPKVQEVACGALSSLVACRDEMKDVVAQLGGIDAVMCAMMLFESNIGVLENACGVLSSLSIGPNHAKAITDAGGIGTIIGAMRNNIDSVVLLEHGCLLLRNLAALDKNYAEEASSSCSTILRGMWEHPDVSGLQREACGALWSLAANSETCKERILFSEGVDVITRIMDHSSCTADFQSEACGAMSQLV